MGQRTKIEYLDLFRFIAITAVVLIHTTSQPVTELGLDRWLYRISFVINTGSQFAVPAFLFLSSLILSYNYEPKWNRNVMKTFFRKRFQYILVPYFIWSLFYFFYANTTIHLPLRSLGTWKRFAAQLAIGDSYYHLYFIFVICQFYVLFPFLISLYKKSNVFRNHMIIWGIVFHIFYYLWDHYVMAIPWSGGTIFTYMMFLLLGMHVGTRFEPFSQMLRRRGGLVIFSTLLLAVLYLGNIWLHMVKMLSFGSFNPFVNNGLYYGYISLCCLSLLYVSNVMGEWISPVVPMLKSIGAVSFGIYFMHPFLIDIWRKHWMTSDSLGYPITIFGSGLFSFIVPWVLFYVLKKYSWSWFLTGK